jgi:hypothetical protein
MQYSLSFDEHHYAIITSLFFLFAGYIFSQKEKLKTKKSEIKCF